MSPLGGPARARGGGTGVLAINAGSSSLKLALFAPGDDGLVPLARDHLDAGDDAALEAWLDARLGEVRAVGHRVVFGGLAHGEPSRVTPARLARWRALAPFAPLHQPGCLAPIELLARQRPALAQVACFDTTFHRTIPEVAQRYALPRALHDAGARRWGYHGLSYEFVAQRLRALDPAAAAGRTIVAHLGSGASLCALHGGRSVACTMGFSVLGGLVMATRPGELDPAIVLWLQRERGMSLAEVETLLYRHSGLAGVAGGRGDLRELLARDDAAAREAVELFVHRIVREVGSLAAALGGIDALVFTAGIGERSAAVRAAVAEGCRWLGVALDAQANAGARGEAPIGEPAARVRCWVVPTDEECVIARHALGVLRHER